MTSLIDVIFLLLLFFMLTSTFSRFAELELTTGSGGRTAAAGPPPVFLKLAEDTAWLNGQEASLEQIPDHLPGLQTGAEGGTLLVALADGTTAQRITDLLLILRPVPDLSVTVLD
jgi:biopolymer transport protein ExbD